MRLLFSRTDSVVDKIRRKLTGKWCTSVAIQLNSGLVIHGTGGRLQINSYPYFLETHEVAQVVDFGMNWFIEAHILRRLPQHEKSGNMLELLDASHLGTPQGIYEYTQKNQQFLRSDKLTFR